ncbi:GntR family transcriptional regulator [Planctomycetota bacterium]|nr:GntR family transcriptional regulator [Planctomycetota bacterium]
MKTLVYQPLLDMIEAKIEQGQLDPGDQVGTEMHLVNTLGISRDSVRRGVDKLVQKGLIERRPGKGLFVKQATSLRSIQIIVPNMLQEQSALIARGAKLAGDKLGAKVHTIDACGSLQQSIQAIRQLPQSKTHGALISLYQDTRFIEAVFELKLSGYPFVLMDQMTDKIDVPMVSADNYKGGYEAGQYLIEKGHTNIGYIGDLKADTIRRRMEGMRDAILDAGLPFDRTKVMQLPINDLLGDWSQAIQICIKQLINREDKPSAIFCHNDEVVAYACHFLKKQGYNIPHDISVMGFDGNSLGQWLDPPLTTVQQPSEQIGRVAMSMLMDLLDNKTNTNNRKFKQLLPTTLIKRESVTLNQCKVMA